MLFFVRYKSEVKQCLSLKTDMKNGEKCGACATDVCEVGIDVT